MTQDVQRHRQGDHADSTAASGEGGTEQLLECTALTQEYRRGTTRSRWPWSKDGQSPTVTALKDISLSIERGDVIGIAGPSGSGKSTLLHLLAGLITPTSGTVELLGTDLSACSARKRTALRYRHIGLVFQRFYLLESLSARANVALPLVRAGVSRGERRERARELLENVGLGDRESHAPGMLSGGEQQRVAIARALVTDPDVILADEPTGELDTDSSERVLDLILESGRDRAVVIASHDRTALAVTDRVVRLHDGRIQSIDDEHSEG